MDQASRFKPAASYNYGNVPEKGGGEVARLINLHRPLLHDAFLEVAAQMKPGETWDVPMWHEVYVIPEGNAEANYINCHNRTGFLTLLDRQPANVTN